MPPKRKATLSSEQPEETPISAKEEVVKKSKKSVVIEHCKSW